MFESCCIKMMPATAWLFLGHKLDKFIHVFVRLDVERCKVMLDLLELMRKRSLLTYVMWSEFIAQLIFEVFCLV